MVKEYVHLSFIQSHRERVFKGLFYSGIIFLGLGICSLILFILNKITFNFNVDFFNWHGAFIFIIFFYLMYVDELKIGFIENIFIKNKKDKYKPFKIWFREMEPYLVSAKEMRLISSGKIKFKPKILK